MKEISLTQGRHEIVSPITGKTVIDSFFGHTVEDVLDIKGHMKVIREHLSAIPAEEILVIYVTGLTPCLQATIAVWLDRNCNGVDRSLDTYPGDLVIAHYDRDGGSYRMSYALTGEEFDFCL